MCLFVCTQTVGEKHALSLKEKEGALRWHIRGRGRGEMIGY